MSRRFAVFIFLVCLAEFSGFARAGDSSHGPVVAVFPLQDLSGKLDKTLLDSLTEYLAAAIAENGRFSIQAPGDIRQILVEKKTESFKECFDERCQIELGKELAANKILSSKIITLADACTVTAALYDLRTQATDITATADGKCTPKSLKNSIDRVASKIRAWGSGLARKKDADFKEGQLGERVKILKDSQGEDTIVRFEPDPEGAVVIVDGVLVCEKTPCSRKFSVGTHSVSIQKKRFLGRQESVLFAKGSIINWALDPLFGRLSVSSVPSGLDVLVNGEKVGTSPLKGFALDPGNYDVLVSSPCFYDKGERIHLEAKQERDLDFELQPKVGGLQVDVKDSEGNDIPADIWVDGKKLGEAPGKFQVSVCARKIQARTVHSGSAEMELSVREGEWKKLSISTHKMQKHGGAKADANSNESGKFPVVFLISPNVGYASVQGIPAQVFTESDNSESSSTVGLAGPTAGFRMDLNLGKLLSVVARYDYLYLDHSGFALLGAGLRYGGLWGMTQSGEDGFAFVPDASMVVGLSFIHGDSGSFEDDMGRKSTSAIANFGLVVSMEVRGLFIFSDLFFVGVSGEFGYLTSFGQGDNSSSSSGYEWSVRADVGIML